MYKDISRIEEMVSMYLVLDEEDQLEIQEKVFELYSKSIHKEAVIREQSSVPAKQKLSENEVKAEIGERTFKRMKEAVEFTSEFDRISADKKAALLIALTNLQKRSSTGTGRKPRVHITISDESISAKELIEELLPEADYENALRIYRETRQKKTHK